MENENEAIALGKMILDNALAPTRSSDFSAACAAVNDNALDFSRLDGVTIVRGSHSSRAGGMCVMELVAYIAGESHTDRPSCVPSEITSLAIRVNDADVWDDDEQRTESLRPLIPLMFRASHSSSARRKRGHIAAHYAAQRAADSAYAAGSAEHAAAGAVDAASSKKARREALLQLLRVFCETAE